MYAKKYGKSTEKRAVKSMEKRWEMLFNDLKNSQTVKFELVNA